MRCELRAGDGNCRMGVAGFRREEEIILEKENQPKEQIPWAGSEFDMIQKQSMALNTLEADQKAEVGVRS